MICSHVHLTASSPGTQRWNGAHLRCYGRVLGQKSSSSGRSPYLPADLYSLFRWLLAFSSLIRVCEVRYVVKLEAFLERPGAKPAVEEKCHGARLRFPRCTGDGKLFDIPGHNVLPPCLLSLLSSFFLSPLPTSTTLKTTVHI